MVVQTALLKSGWCFRTLKSCRINGIMLLVMGILLASGCSHKFMVVNEPPEMPPPRILNEKPRVALVLSGGAFDGSAHVGVIKVLEHAGIPIDLIVGTSAGSLVGAMYADYPHIDSLIPLVNSIKTRDVFDFSLLRSSEGLVSGKRLQTYLNKHLHVKNIEETKIPYVAVTTDMKRGISVALKSGPIAPSVNASCAIPYIFEPVQMYGTLFSDGGILNNVATDVAHGYDPMVIIAVDVMSVFDTNPDLNNKVEVLYRAFAVAAHVNHAYNERFADIIIAPDLSGMPLLSASENDTMMQLGIRAAEEKLPEIRKLLIEKGLMH